LVGEASGDEYAIGQVLQLRLAEANPVSGALRFELPEGRYAASPGKKPERVLKRRGRPPNIRHQGRRR
jgi:ribonuclease R